MTTLVGMNTMTSALPHSTRLHGSKPSGALPSYSQTSTTTSSSQGICHRSTLWGSNSSGCRLPIPVVGSDLTTTSRPSSSVVIATASLFEQEQTSKRSSSVAAAGTDAATSAKMSSAAADDAAAATSSSSSRAADLKSWRAARAARKTTRRRALAICLALASVTQRGPPSSGVEQEREQDQSSLAQPRDFITVSPQTTAGAPNPTFERAESEGYTNLVTVSTGSSDSSNGGVVKGLPSWMRGKYNLCMGDGFHVQLPADWHMHDTQGGVYGTVLRYEDKADPSTNVIVLKSPTSQSRTDDLGNPEDWIRKQAYLLTGSSVPLQFQSGNEGMDAARRFHSGRVSIARVLNVDEPKNKQGLTYYNYEILTKQGRKQTDALHELVSAVVNNGNLYMCRVQTGEDRWQQSTQNMAQRIVDSFQITGFKIHA